MHPPQNAPMNNETEDLSTRISFRLFKASVGFSFTKADFHLLNSKEASRTKRTTIQGCLKKNERLNAPGEILPYDDNRVKIKDDQNQLDYINASWINEPRKENEYDSLIPHSYLTEKSRPKLSLSPNHSVSSL